MFASYVQKGKQGMHSEDLIICRCEEVTLGEINAAIDSGCETIDEIKRATRAGMGPCQGRTCFRLIQRILAERLGVSVNDVAPMTVQFPVRPVRLSAIVTAELVEGKEAGHSGSQDDAP